MSTLKNLTVILLAAMQFSCASSAVTGRKVSYGGVEAVLRDPQTGQILPGPNGEKQHIYTVRASDGGLTEAGSLEITRPHTLYELETGSPRADAIATYAVQNGLQIFMGTLLSATGAAANINNGIVGWKALGIQEDQAQAYKDWVRAVENGAYSSRTVFNNNVSANAAAESNQSQQMEQTQGQDQNQNQRVAPTIIVPGSGNGGHGHQDECQECGGWNGSSLNGETFLLKTPKGPVKFSFVTPFKFSFVTPSFG